MRHRVRQGRILLVAFWALALSGCASEAEHKVLSAGDLQDGYRHVSGYGPSKSSSGSFLAAYRARVTNDLDAEIRFLKEALEAAPDSAELRLRLFYATMAAGQVEEAVELIGSLPNESDNFNRVRLTRIVEAIRKDEADVEELVEGFPDNHFGKILKPLFAAWLSAGRDDAETVQAALEPLKFPDRPLILYSLHTAYILDVIGQSSEAAEFYEKAWAAIEDPPARWIDAYGRHLEVAGDVEAAKKTYIDYLEKNDSPIIEHALERLRKGAIRNSSSRIRHKVLPKPFIP